MLGMQQNKITQQLTASTQPLKPGKDNNHLINFTTLHKYSFRLSVSKLRLQQLLTGFNHLFSFELTSHRGQAPSYIAEMLTPLI